MDCTPKYKPAKKVRKNLLDPPPYCRSTDRKMALANSIAPVKLEVSDPSKILLLVESLSDCHSKSLEKKINKYLQNETESQICFLISVLTEEAYVQVMGTEKLEQMRYKIPQEVIAGMCKNCNDSSCKTYQDLDSTFQRIIQDIMGTEDCKIIVVPIFGRPQSAISLLLVCLVNPKKDIAFVTNMVQETFKFCLTLLLNTTMSEEESKVRKDCEMLLDVAKKLFQHLGDLGELLQEIMVAARNLTKAERCSLFLIDEHKENLVAKVFDGSSSSNDMKFPKHKGVAGHVYNTGRILNIKDAYTHPLFYKKLDEVTGFKTRNILCFPIRDNEGIIGVAQLCNKKEGHFTLNDEESAMAFSVYCGLAIMHSLVYKKIHEAQVKTQLSNELMMYHMKVEEDQFSRFLHCKIAHNFDGFDKFKFMPRYVNFDDTPCYMLWMFNDLNLIEKFNIKKELLCRFILYVMKGYRDTPYHNWIHAFSVAHFAYLIIKNFRLIEKNYLTHLEALALLTSCLGHDIDHRGTTNAFQLKIGSPLANLYSSEGSVMERHHLSQTICILNTQKCNFLECLDNSSYQRCLDLLRDNILATDLANHFKILPEMEEFLTARFMKDRIEHKRMLCSLIMTCSDLSDQTKDFKLAKEVAQKIYEEFFKQGDMEKRMGNKPMEMMDREKASIPDLQVEFLDDVCLPAFRILAALFPKARDLIEVIESTRVCWEASKTVFEKYCLKGQASFDVLMSTTLDAEVLSEIEEHTISTRETIGTAGTGTAGTGTVGTEDKDDASNPTPDVSEI